MFYKSNYWEIMVGFVYCAKLLFVEKTRLNKMTNDKLRLNILGFIVVSFYFSIIGFYLPLMNLCSYFKSYWWW